MQRTMTTLMAEVHDLKEHCEVNTPKYCPETMHCFIAQFHDLT